MTRTYVEILILFLNALAAGLLVFISGVLQKVMTDMDAATFQTTLGKLDHYAMRSPFALVVSTLPMAAFIPYFIIFGFGNAWFTAGAVVFLLASTVSKLINMPIYKRVSELPSTETAALEQERTKLKTGNFLRAAVQFVSALLMLIGLFGVS